MPPGLFAGAALCSWSRGHSGTAAVGITNTADTAPSASYAVTVKGKTVRSKGLADGKSGGVFISGLPAGRFGVSVAGSDGTHGTTTVSPHHVAKYRVKGGRRKTVTAMVLKVHKTTVTIKVGTHKIASETYTLG